MLDYLFTHTSLLFFVQNLWRDEAFSYVLAIQPLVKILQLTAGDFNPPLYYILLRFWMTLFGTSEIAMRSLSFVFYLGALYILYDTCLYVLKIPHKRTSVYFLFIIFNPFLLTYAFEARMYMMVTFFVTLSYFSLLTGKKKLFIISTILGLYTHYFSIFIYAIQFLIELFVLWDKNRQYSMLYQQIRDLWQSFLQIFAKNKKSQSAFLFFIIPALCFIPWAIFMITQHNFSDGAFWIQTPLVTDFFYLPFILYTGYERVFGSYYHGTTNYTIFHTFLNMLLWTILLTPLSIFAYHKIKSLDIKWHKKVYLDHYRTKAHIFLWAFFAPLFIFFLSFISQPLFLPRYFIFAAPGFLLLIIIAFEKILFYSEKNFVFSASIVGILAIFLVLSTKKFNMLNLQYHSKRNIKDLYTEVIQLKQSHDVIYLDSELDYHLAQYYMGLHEKIYIYNKKYENIPQYVGKVLIPATAMAHVLPTYPARAFVVYYHWYNIRSLH